VEDVLYTSYVLESVETGMSFFAELKRRKVIRTTVAYLAGAWLVAQVADLVLENIRAPEWIMPAIFLALLIGFPVALVFSWAYELTPEGLKLDVPSEPEDESLPVARPVSFARQVVAWSIGVVILVSLLIVFGLNVGGLRDSMLVARGPITSLAVLPLDNLSGDPEQQYFTDGMTEALIAELGQLGGLRVTSRTSSMRYRNSDMSAGEIARELGVDALIEGSVLRGSDDVRITLQLIDGRTDSHLFAQSFQHKLEDILALQATVARAVTEEIEITVSPEAEARLANPREVDPEVYDLWLRGNYFLNEPQSDLNPELPLRALEAYRKAAALAPDYAPAHAGIARAYLALGSWWSPLPSDAYFPHALNAANKALELDPGLANAHFALGLVRHQYLWDWDGAHQAFKQAMALEPSEASNAKGMQDYANFLIAMGHFDEALGVARRAAEIEPFAFWAHGEIAWALLMAGRHEEALIAVQVTMELMPSDFEVNVLQQLVYYSAAGYKERAAERLPPLETVKETYAVTAMGWFAYYYARLGRPDEARDLRDHLLEQRSQAYVSPHFIALAYLGLGEREEALEWLERGLDERDPMCVWLKEHYIYNELRTDSRFQQLIARMKFPQN